MKIKCMWNDRRDKDLTVGKEYEVISESNLMYLVKSDSGEEIQTLKERFEIIGG